MTKRPKDPLTTLLTTDGVGKAAKQVALSFLLKEAFEAGTECAIQHRDDYCGSEGELRRGRDFWRHMDLSANGYVIRVMEGK